MNYRVFDLCLSCGFELPELPTWERAEADLHVQLGPPDDVDAARAERHFEWRDPDGRVIASVARMSKDLVYDFPNVAQFVVRGREFVWCQPAPRCPPETLRHLLLGQIVPRLAGERGRFVVHASAVQLGEAGVVAFVGDSGAGKTTLAASFEAHGARLLADDSVLMAPEASRVRAVGAFSGLRLKGESGRGDARQSHREHGAVEPLAPAATLAAIFMLADPGTASGDDVRIESVSPSRAASLLANSVFSLDPLDPRNTQRALSSAAAILGTGVPLRSLVYPRRFDRLDSVRDAVRSFVS